ncbi:MAG: monovalent cation/H+ antiporter subunit D [Burkholderiales bacterium]|nr:MAG: monovalent cation/H+ antiporter subunit D [Burkholderiales bacterium]
MTDGALALSQHLPVVPVLLPLLTAAAMLALGEQRRGLKAVVNLASTAAGLAVAIVLLSSVSGGGTDVTAYLPGNWPVPFGIVLVVDRLSAMMAVLTGSVGLASVLYSLARWHHAGVHFHVLFQLQLMGLYGAFLTGDLFNLFVFFEVMLAASYGLLMHGGGMARVRAGLHYIAINLVASMLLLIGIAVLYGVTGTLNMADVAQKLSLVPDSDRGLLLAGAALLGVAFLAKAAQWPLNFWLPPAYTAASPPAAALFVILTKVGGYAILRLWTLYFPADAGASALFGADVLMWGGIATLGFGALGMLATQDLDRFAAYSVIGSSGTLVAAIGFDRPAVTAGALFYLASSTLAACALFLLVELLRRSRQRAVVPLAIRDDGGLTFAPESERHASVKRDAVEAALVGRAIPSALAFLGVAFALVALVVTGLPPLSGFVGKVALLSALLEVRSAAAWTLSALLLVSGLFATIALMRVGMRHFWSPSERPPPRLRIAETVPIGLLLGACVMLVVAGEPALRYLRGAAEALHEPTRYIDAVNGARVVERAAAAAAAPSSGWAR